MNNQTISKLTVLLVALFMLSISATTNAGKKTITYYHTDALGSIVAASDEQGDLIWRKTYDPYGNEVITTENGEEYEGQAYTGKPYDKETGLLYLGQRYYDPEIKRFLSMDPVGFVASNPASFNRYAYANNNPYKFIDPDGRSALTAFGGVLHESYNFTQGRGFNGSMVMGALVDGYNGEGKGFGWSLFEDVTSFVPLGSSVKGYRFLKGHFGNTPTQLVTTNLATNSGSKALQLLPDFSNGRKAFEHYAKHSKGVVLGKKGKAKVKPGGADVPEFGSYDAYVGAARSFWSPSARNGILQGTRADGSILRFEPSTGYFGVMRNGKISTFFRPNGNSAAGLKYFRDQL